jgi:bacteriocin-like protein
MNEATEKQPVENQKPSEELTEQDLNNVTGGNIVQNIVDGALAAGGKETVSLPYGTVEWTYSKQKGN